ncbi:MAG: hypothetical protein U0230_14350 [Polyangiales bacterium]
MLTRVETSLIGILLLVLMFGMGTTLTLARFREVLRHPKAFLIGLASQFVLMPLSAFALARALALPNEAAIGLVIMGACPGGTTSNLFAHLSKADVALSLSMTAASKLVGVVAMPIALYLFARPFTTAEVLIPYGEIVKTLVVLLLPVGLGVGLRHRFGEGFAVTAEKVGSAAGIAVLVALISISVSRNSHLLGTIPPSIYAAAILLGAAGMLFGDLAGRAFRLPVAQRRAVSLETGIQNSPLAFAIVALSFAGDVQTKMLEVQLLYALFILLQASVVTVVYRRLGTGGEPATDVEVAPAT